MKWPFLGVDRAPPPDITLGVMDRPFLLLCIKPTLDEIHFRLSKPQRELRLQMVEFATSHIMPGDTDV